MTTPEIVQQDYQVLVVAYDEKALAVLAASPLQFGVTATHCTTFAQAQESALSGSYRGLLVDLTTMVKAKDTEKFIAHTLTGIYPTLRVKSMGSMLIPMIMAGDAKQDKSLNDFFTKTCAGFVPRRLRAHKRKDICIPARINSERCYTVNLSWNGAFIADPKPERYALGQEITVSFVVSEDTDLVLEATVVRIQQWGERRPPGIGVQFKEVGQEEKDCLFTILRSDRETDSDRLA
jgi:Tfp pilus assembly protein PilZ